MMVATTRALHTIPTGTYNADHLPAFRSRRAHTPPLHGLHCLGKPGNGCWTWGPTRACPHSSPEDARSCTVCHRRMTDSQCSTGVRLLGTRGTLVPGLSPFTTPQGLHRAQGTNHSRGCTVHGVSAWCWMSPSAWIISSADGAPPPKTHRSGRPSGNRRDGEGQWKSHQRIHAGPDQNGARRIPTFLLFW